MISMTRVKITLFLVAAAIGGPAVDGYGQKAAEPCIGGKGTVKWYNVEKGYGFITGENGENAFVHRTFIQGGVVALREGQRVKFKAEMDSKGCMAVKIWVVGGAAKDGGPETPGKQQKEQAWVSGSGSSPVSNSTKPCKGGRGVVKWYNYEKGYGFITVSGREDTFVHSSFLQDGVKSLSEGDAVRFEAKRYPQGCRAVKTWLLGRP